MSLLGGPCSLTSIITTLFQTILPVLLIAGAGYLLQRKLTLDTRTVSRLCLYILTPSLGFSSIAQSQMSRDELWRMASLAALVVLSMVALGWLAAGILRLEKQERSTLQLALAFANSGNFGLSVCYFAFGDEGLERAMVYFITSSVLVNSLGVYLASRGGRAGSISASLRNVVSMPLLYGVLLGLLVNFTGWRVPAPLLKTADLAGRAAVPTMLLVLGMQLARSRLGDDRLVLSVGTVLKLIIAPLIALLFATMLRMTGVTWQVALVESATPTAVTTVIISEEFEASPRLASGMVLITTLCSLVTLTVLLALIS